MDGTSVARVLIVDDDPGFRALLAQLLAGAGHIVVGEAATGSEAVELAARLRPDVITMDLEMPAMNGAEATAAICATGSCPSIVIVSGSRSSHYLAEALTAGARWHVAKADVGAELTAVVEALAVRRTAA